MYVRPEGAGRLHTDHAARTRILPHPEKRLKRKIIEIAITFQLEHRFNKKQIFEMYANQINLGQRGSFAINGFGEAAKAYFGRDLNSLTWRNVHCWQESSRAQPLESLSAS